jgi:hypothetical protein
MRSGEREELLRRLPWLLADRVRDLEEAQEGLRAAVRDLVLAGYSWADVGRMLGVSRQAARKRFGAEVDWWREHMGNQMPWDDWTLGLGPEQLAEHLGDVARMRAAGPAAEYLAKYDHLPRP